MLVPKQRLYQLPGALLKAKQVPSQFVSKFMVQETISDSQNVLDDLERGPGACLVWLFTSLRKDKPLSKKGVSGTPVLCSKECLLPFCLCPTSHLSVIKVIVLFS